GDLDGGEDARIGAAPADVALHGPADLGFAGVWLVAQERHGGHDHAGRAVAALESVRVEEGLLHGMEVSTALQAFDGGDLLAGGDLDRRDARAHRLPVEQHGARAALRFPAAVFRPGEIQIVAQYEEEAARRLHIDAVPRTVHV